MNSNKLYIPNPQTWIKYYENVGKNGHNPRIIKRQHGGNQIGGSLTGTDNQFIVPIEPPAHMTNTTQQLENMTMSSPSKQFLEQARHQIKEKKSRHKKKAFSKNN